MVQLRISKCCCAGEQAAYRESNDEEVGNGAIVKALLEMEKYWDALDGDFLRETLYNERSEDGTVAGRKTEQVINHRVRASLAVLAWRGGICYMHSFCMVMSWPT